MNAPSAPPSFVPLEAMLDGRRKFIIEIESRRLVREGITGAEFDSAIDSLACEAERRTSFMRERESPSAARARALGFEIMYPAERARDFLNSFVAIMDGQGKLQCVVDGYCDAMEWLDAIAEAHQISETCPRPNVKVASPSRRRL